MIKRIFSIFFALVLLFSALPCNVMATSSDIATEVIHFDDGSYIEVSIVSSPARSIFSRNGYKKYTYYDSNNNISWEATLSATYIYTGESATCTTTSCAVTVYDNQWYEISKSTARSGNVATMQLTMGRKFLGVTVDKPAYTITLTCDKDGNLS